MGEIFMMIRLPVPVGPRKQRPECGSAGVVFPGYFANGS